MLSLSKSPFPITYRELWLPPAINGVGLPSAISGGHALALTGAQKRTTADGVRFTGAANSNIVVADNAIQDGKAAFHITIRFKLGSTFAAGAASNFYFLNKVNAATYLRVYLKAADGKLYWEQDNGGGAAGFSLTSTTVSWAAGTWYIVTLEMTDTPTQSLLVNGLPEDTDTSAAVVTPAAGNMYLGASAAAGVDGIVGVISWVVIGVGTTAATALTAAEETDLSKGIPPPTAKVQYMYLFDEGRGVTATDRGSAGGNGTLDTACTWDFGQVRQPVLSLEGINDYASSANINISGDTTIVFVIKAKSKYNGFSVAKNLLRGYIDDNNFFVLQSSNTIPNIRLTHAANGTAIDSDLLYIPTIDEYLVFILSFNSGTSVTWSLNGTQIATAASAGIMSAATATIYVGRRHTATNYDVSKTLYLAPIDGAFTAKQGLIYSRWLRDIFNLPINM